MQESYCQFEIIFFQEKDKSCLEDGKELWQDFLLFT